MTSRIWHSGAFHEDGWTRLAADSELPPDGSAVLVPLAVFLADANRYAGYNGSLAVEVAPGESVAPLEPHLPRLSMIALAFPKFSDGRNYSNARLLRERYRYGGELRATGDVLEDQIPLMRRCGIDSFEVSHEPTARALVGDRLAEVHHYYQPIPSSAEIPAGTRPWARRPAD